MEISQDQPALADDLSALDQPLAPITADPREYPSTLNPHRPITIEDALTNPELCLVQIDEVEYARRVAGDKTIQRMEREKKAWEEHETEKTHKWTTKQEEVRERMKVLRSQRAVINVEIKRLDGQLSQFKTYYRGRPTGLRRLTSRIIARKKRIKAIMIARAANSARLDAIKRLRAR